MKVLSLEEIKNGALENVELGVTVGNFDGVHLGHQSLLKDIKEACEKADIKLMVITFVPHPMKIIKAQNSFLINSYGQRRCLLESQGADYLLEIDFTRDFSTLSPENFLQNYIFNIDGVKAIYLGYDFTFGSNKQGGHDLVSAECSKRSIDFYVQKEFEKDGEIVSSSLIRNELEKNNVDKVNELLGRPFNVTGSVVKGAGRGRQIGFPTANISFFPDKKLPGKGVYVTKTRYKDQDYYSVTNIGVNPTFTAENKLSVETHILDFNNDIYGEEIVVQFMTHLRDEKKFDSVNDLIQQINLDVEKTREYYKS